MKKPGQEDTPPERASMPLQRCLISYLRNRERAIILPPATWACRPVSPIFYVLQALSCWQALFFIRSGIPYISRRDPLLS